MPTARMSINRIANQVGSISALSCAWQPLTEGKLLQPQVVFTFCGAHTCDGGDRDNLFDVTAQLNTSEGRTLVRQARRLGPQCSPSPLAPRPSFPIRSLGKSKKQHQSMSPYPPHTGTRAAGRPRQRDGVGDQDPGPLPQPGGGGAGPRCQPRPPLALPAQGDTVILHCH